MRRRKAVALIHLLVLLLILASCDQSFEPFQESDIGLSVSGYLDASADTQWIRVTPLRQSIFTPDEPPDASVTIESLSDGRTMVLRDSTFRHPATYLDSTVVRSAHTFWTNEDIKPQSSYRLTVTPAGGPASVATLAIPADYPVVIRNQVQVISPTNLFSRVTVRIAMEHLALLQVRCSSGGGGSGFGVPFDITPPNEGLFDIPVVRRFFLGSGEVFECPVPDTRIYVVVSGAPWPRGPAIANSALSMLEVPSGITHAVGFVAGVVTKLMPWETCTLLPPGGACDLTYNERSVRLEGRVLDCGAPVDTFSNVTLTEVRPNGAVPVRVWSADTPRRTGVYKLDLLEPGLRYAVRVTSLKAAGTPPTPLLEPFEDTLVFAPGERRRVDFVLKNRLSGCG